MIPFVDFKAQFAAIESEIRQALDEVLRSGWYILGSQLQAFEQEFSAYLGGPQVVGVASGTDAIQLALLALDIGPEDEVILPANTCVPTICGIIATGARPVVADVTEETLTLDPASVEARLTPSTKAIVPVHLYGHPCDMDPLNGSRTIVSVN
jgi:dTDP-4-amino-4,6-dideoxygalactose transaminase